MLLWCVFFLLVALRLAQCEDTSFVVAVTACGKKARYHMPTFLQSLIEQPSATRRRIELHIFCDEDVRRIFVETGCVSRLHDGHFRSVWFHNVSDFSILTTVGSKSLSLLGKYWKEDQSRYSCASFKLDMINMVPVTVDRIAYMDIDTVVFGDLAELFIRFDMHPTAILHVALESYRLGRGWYADAKHAKRGDRKKHFLPPTGLNSGVMLMNLALMRLSAPPLDVRAFVGANDEAISMGDQDVLNSWAFHHQDQVKVLPCRWNRRSDSDCLSLDATFASPTNASYKDGSFNLLASAGGVMHASRRVFMRHVVFPRHYDLHLNLTQAFFRSCNLSSLIVSYKRGNSVFIL